MQSSFHCSIVFPFKDQNSFQELKQLFTIIDNYQFLNVEVLCFIPKGQAELKGQIEYEYDNNDSIKVQESFTIDFSILNSLYWLMEGSKLGSGKVIIKGLHGFNQFISQFPTNSYPQESYILLEKPNNHLPIYFETEVLACSQDIAFKIFQNLHFESNASESEAYFLAKEFKASINIVKKQYSNDNEIDFSPRFSLLGPLGFLLHYLHLFND